MNRFRINKTILAVLALIIWLLVMILVIIGSLFLLPISIWEWAGFFSIILGIYEPIFNFIGYPLIYLLLYLFFRAIVKLRISTVNLIVFALFLLLFPIYTVQFECYVKNDVENNIKKVAVVLPYISGVVLVFYSPKMLNGYTCNEVSNLSARLSFSKEYMIFIIQFLIASVLIIVIFIQFYKRIIS